jgi:hypothetical protein
MVNVLWLGVALILKRTSIDTSGVKDLSAGGLFIETRKVCPIGATVELHFLVQDGQIRANATVRYVKAGSGLGLQLETVRSEDQARFAEMVKG